MPLTHRLTSLSFLFRGRLDGSMRFPVPASEKDAVPVRKPTFLSTRFASQELRTTWLGHACHYTEFPSGLRVLFDPVLEHRCSPFTFAGPERYTRPPCTIVDLPFLDAVVISHSHYDHLSLPTVKDIKKNFPNAHFFVGLGLRSWFEGAGITNVTELDWWEDAEVTVQPETDKETRPITATFSALPSQHTSSRNSFDSDQTLWCSWAIASPKPPSPESKCLYFAGDTGYRSVPRLPDGEDDWADKYVDQFPSNPDFKKIGNLRGPFDLGLIPIGAYEPRYLMSAVHADPNDAVEMFRATKCRRALGIHWSTWPLTTEPILEPPVKLREALKKRGLEETGVFDVCDIGESRSF